MSAITVASTTRNAVLGPRLPADVAPPGEPGGGGPQVGPMPRAFGGGGGAPPARPWLPKNGHSAVPKFGPPGLPNTGPSPRGLPKP